MEQHRRTTTTSSAFHRLQAVFGGGKKSPPNTATSTSTAAAISLRYLATLSNKYPDTTTITEFVQQEIKPQTTTEAYVDMLARENPTTVRSTAQFFVSYVWAYPLQEVVNALVHTLLTKTGENDVFVWMDAFCINQHQLQGKTAVTPNELQQTFEKSLKAIGKMVMVLVNWQDPSYPKRIWCVFEAYMSKASGTDVVLAMSPTEEASLAHAMIRNQVSVEFLNTLFGSVNVERATATILEDQNAILTLIRTFGVAQVNAVVLTNLKQWLVLGGELAMQNLAAHSSQAGNIYLARYAVHKALGEYDTALQWVDKALAIAIKVYGPEHSETATILNNTAECLSSLGRFAEALPHYEETLAIDMTVHGPHHPSTAITLNNKADCLTSLGRYDEALPLYHQATAISLTVYGPNHSDYAIKLNNTAMCLSALGRYDEALVLYDQSLAIRLQVHGPDHPAIATALNNRAGCLKELGRFTEALSEYDKAEKILHMTVGDHHPNVASTLNSRAECLTALGRYEEALPLYEQILAIDMKVYGPHHPEVATDLNNKAWCLRNLGRETEGKSVGKQALDIVERVLGHDHPNTVIVRGSWG